jgi:hypothetical protein
MKLKKLVKDQYRDRKMELRGAFYSGTRPFMLYTILINSNAVTQTSKPPCLSLVRQPRRKLTAERK